ncbi:MAG: hypothetical protein EA412_02385 [Chitinophagaceae bacterium]|nr:MAG: hypothetical protein EA412_02385 [Chitinophagaceae bacterium]
MSAQVKVGDNPSVVNPAAIFEMESSDKGFLLPRLSESERDAMVPPITAGLIIFNTDSDCLEVFNGTAWINLCSQDPCASVPNPDSPIEGVHGTDLEEITWNWGAVSGANGYLYASVNDLDQLEGIVYTNEFLSEGLVCETAYTLYVWAFNECGISDVTTLNAITDNCPTGFVCQIGETGPGGGIIFYCDDVLGVGLEAAQPGWDGLSTTDPFTTWSTPNVSVTTTQDDLFEGANNTAILVDLHNTTSSTFPAAVLCDNYSVIFNGQTIDDWYMPSRLELNELSVNIGSASLPGLFSSNNYFSSTHRTAQRAWMQNPVTNAIPASFSGPQKNSTNQARVRPIRTFTY